MSMYIENEAQYQRQKALATKRLFVRHARNKAAESLKNLHSVLKKNNSFPATLPNTTLFEQQERERGRISWLADKFEEYAEEAHHPLALFAACRLKETAENLEMGLYEPTGRKRELQRNPGEFGTLLTNFRLKRNITQMAVSKQSGLSNGNISIIEGGQREPIFSTLSHYIRGTGASFTDEDVLSLMRVSIQLIEKQEDQVKSYPSSQEIISTLNEMRRTRPELLLAGNYLRYLREHAVIDKKVPTREALAKKAGYAKVTIDKYELNLKIPTMNSLIDILSTLGFNSTSLETYLAWVISLEQSFKSKKAK